MNDALSFIWYISKTFIKKVELVSILFLVSTNIYAARIKNEKNITDFFPFNLG